MPELPEVEIAARNLRAWARGRRIGRAEGEPAAQRIFRPGRLRTFVAALRAGAWAMCAGWGSTSW